MKWLASTVLGAAVVAAVAAWVVSSDVLSLSLEELEETYATPDSRFMDVDGVRVHYMDQGEGPAVVLLHASFMTLRTWDDLAEELSKQYRVIRPDLLIAGLTGPEPNDNYTFDRNLELVKGLTEQLGVERFSILATSSGGIVGFNFAARYPELVERLILANSAGLPRSATSNPNRPRGTAFSRWLDARYRSKTRQREVLDTNFIEPNEPPEWLVQMSYDMRRRDSRRREAAHQTRNFRTGDPESVLAKITAPTMILWGLDNLTVVHLEADVFEHWLVNAPTLKRKYPGVGHYLYLEIPDQFNADVAAFLAGELDGELKQTQRIPVSPEEITMNNGIKNLAAVASLALAPALGSGTETDCEGHEDILNHYLGMHEVLFMQRDTTRVGEFYADEFISHNQDEGGGAVTKMNHAPMIEMWENSKKNDPGRVLINDLIICTDQFVVARVTINGSRVVTPRDGSPPERRSFSASATDTYRIKDGKVVERWGNNDSVSILRQLGMWPEELE
jgi:pimeloyl-ACP methyl ester carboxylesterase/predicted ester cyclase